MTIMEEQHQNTDWADVLDRILATMGISIAQLATGLGVTRQTANSRAKGRPSIDKIAEIADLLDVPLQVFFGHPRDAVAWLLENRPEIFEPGWEPDWVRGARLSGKDARPVNPPLCCSRNPLTRSSDRYLLLEAAA